MARRFDVASFSASDLQRTPHGGVIVPAAVTRSGVFEYSTPSGAIRREYRPPEEVFSDRSLKSLRSVVVTNRHPESMVNSSNYKELSVGRVDGLPRQDGQLLFADMAIDDEFVVGAVESGDICECSAGYDVDLDYEPGTTPEGEPYDAIQRNIIYNHVALGPKGWGRAGAEVSLRLDSADDQISPDFGAEVEKMDEENEAPKETEEQVKDADGEVGAENEADALRAQVDMLKTEIEELKIKLAEASQKAKEEAAEEMSEASAPREDEEVEEAPRMDSKAFAAAVRARTALELKAKNLLGKDARLDGKSDREIQVEAIKSARSDFDDTGKSDDYVSAAFDMLPERSGSSNMFRVDSGAPAPRADSLDEMRKKRDENAAAAWKVGKS